MVNIRIISACLSKCGITDIMVKFGYWRDAYV